VTATIRTINALNLKLMRAPFCGQVGIRFVSLRLMLLSSAQRSLDDGRVVGQGDVTVSVVDAHTIRLQRRGRHAIGYHVRHHPPMNRPGHRVTNAVLSGGPVLMAARPSERQQPWHGQFVSYAGRAPLA
jgi:hypothetical protein